MEPTMARIPLIDSRDELSEAEGAIYAETLRLPGVTQQITGPQRLVLRNARLNHAFQVFVSALRTETTITELDHELAILATVREKRSAYPWGAHVTRARAAGVSETAIELIRSGAPADRLRP